MMRVTVPADVLDLDARRLARDHPLRKLLQWHAESDACIALETTEEGVVAQFRWRQTLRRAVELRRRRGPDA